MATDKHAPEPVTIVIFGGAGDLAHRKLLPALYNLLLDGLLPSPFAVVGVGRKDFNDEQYRGFAREGANQFSRRPVDETKWSEFAQGLFFVNVDVTAPEAYPTLGARLDIIEHERGLPGSRVYYLALPPALFGSTAQQIKRARLISPADARPFTRLVVEKPIGHDLQSAMAIDAEIASAFDERQIFRIDHYLGKETVQNILVLRFANNFLEPFFNQRYIDHVQITVAEEEGIGTRAGYYEHAGALRDMVQNHLLQLLALVAMEPPHSLDADVIRDEKLEVVESLRPIGQEDVDRYVVRGQSRIGVDGQGQPIPGYRDERGVDPASRTETYVALEVFVDNWRWAGVPFFLRTGKRLPKRASEISIHIKDVPPVLFNAHPDHRLVPNVLIIRIQPNEGFALSISSKVPGAQVTIEPVSMDFTYSEVFGASSPEAYERLLLDIMSGDATLFMRRDQVERSWQWIMPILEHWSSGGGSPEEYGAATWGPDAADRLIESTGRRWRTP